MLKKKETETEETEEETETETETDNESLKSLKSISPMMKKKPLREKITQEEETTTEESETEESETEEEQTPETEEEQAPETKIIVPEEDDKKKSLSVSDDKKYISMFTDGVFSILEQSKPLIEAITEIEESLNNINDENKRYEIIEYAAEVLSKATDKEGNKLFKDKAEAKTALFNIHSMNKHRIKYKLPINVQKEIKEKQPITVNPMLKRQIINHSINRNIYQY